MTTEPKPHEWVDSQAFSVAVSFYVAVVTGILGWVVARFLTRR